MQEPYVAKQTYKLREKNPLNYIHNSPFRFKPNTENERIRDVSTHYFALYKTHGYRSKVKFILLIEKDLILKDSIITDGDPKIKLNF